MDPVANPYAPGAGAPPPELAGRDELLETVRVATQRIRAGRQAKSVLMIGLRGVGKTVLLDRMRDDAEAAGLHTLRIEAPEGRSLPAIEFDMAYAHAQFGDVNAAVALLKHSLQVPYGVTVAQLRMFPIWAPIKNDPRFQALLTAPG